MAKLITKFRYLKPSKKRKAGGYATYIATREGVEKLPQEKTYADYIATRPRSQGLFTDAEKEINLRQLSKELNQYQGNLWTVIISLSREDAERLGFDTATRWRDFLRSERSAIAEQFHIPQGNLRWYVAFHNEKHHPHVHLMVWSEDEKEGYLSEKGVEKLRSSFAKSIFAQDWCNVYDHYLMATSTAVYVYDSDFRPKRQLAIEGFLSAFDAGGKAAGQGMTCDDTYIYYLEYWQNSANGKDIRCNIAV